MKQYQLEEMIFEGYPEPEDAAYIIEAVDTWNMTSEVIAQGKKGLCKVRMPERQWMAAVARREV